jgi:hypothetical protein
LPNTSERTKQDLSLHLTLGVPLIATEGYSSETVGKVYTRARELMSRQATLRMSRKFFGDSGPFTCCVRNWERLARSRRSF